jgi:hypothetical protein
MAAESPLFQSSMELLGHSISHFNGSTELDRKLVILHLANAIELILKDLVLDAGESIYKNPKETVTIHGCTECLKAKTICVPFLNKVELLIDERNSLQHRYGSPNELTTIFYMNIAVDFFKEILSKHYTQDFDEVIAQFTDEKDLMAFRMREPRDETELENLKKLAKVHPLGSLLSAMAYLEKIIMAFLEKLRINKDMSHAVLIGGGPISYRWLSRYGIEPSDALAEQMDEARKIRNLAAHGRKEPTKDDVNSTISAIEKYEAFLNGYDLEQAKAKVQKCYEEREARYSGEVEIRKIVAG